MTAVTLRRDGDVAWVTLSRPEAGNAIDMALAEELVVVATELAGDPTVRCVVLTGAGRMFCVGGDVGAFAAVGDQTPAFLRTLADKLHRAVLLFAQMIKPFVTVVNGPAAGAGLSLALLGDYALASRSAHFTAAYTGIGLTPDGGMTWLLPRLIGLRRAQDMILTNRRIGAEEAATHGLINRVSEDDRLLADGETLARMLAAAPTAALGAARTLLQSGQTASLAEQLEREASAIAAAGARAESREGVAAFVGRRTPDFRGK